MVAQLTDQVLGELGVRVTVQVVHESLEVLPWGPLLSLQSYQSQSPWLQLDRKQAEIRIQLSYLEWSVHLGCQSSPVASPLWSGQRIVTTFLSGTSAQRRSATSVDGNP